MTSRDAAIERVRAYVTATGVLPANHAVSVIGGRDRAPQHITLGDLRPLLPGGDEGSVKTGGIGDDVRIAMMRASGTLTPDVVKLSMHQAARVLSALPFGHGDVGKAIGLIERAKRQADALIAGDDMNPARIYPDPDTIVEWLDQALVALQRGEGE